jgi:hypothetical protein
MAQRTWIGGASTTAQVDTMVVGGTIETTDEFVMTMTDESGATQALTVVAGSTTLSTVVTNIVTAWNASTLSLFARCTAAAASPNVTITADTAGLPFYLSVTSTETGGGAADAQTYTTSTTTPNSGPYDYGCGANFSENAVPVATNDVLITGTYSILYGLRQSGVALADFVVDAGYRGNIGAPGSPLSIDPDTFAVNGGGTMYFNLNAANIPARVSGGTKTHLNGSNLTTLIVDGGSVSVGVDPGDAPTIATLSLQTGGTATVGPFTTLTTFKQAGGTGHLYAAATTVEAQSGTLTTYGSGAITTLTNSGATVNSSSSGTIATLNAKGGTTDLSRSRVARTVSTLNHYKGGTVTLDTAVVTVTTYAPSGHFTLAAN